MAEQREPSSISMLGKGGRQKVTLAVNAPVDRQDQRRQGVSVNSRHRHAAKIKVEVHTKQEDMEMPKKKPIEDVINLEVLMQLKTAFAMADKDGGGDLSCDEFVKAFMDILGKELGEDGLRQMFMKIDANADGTIDWDEFSSFMLLQNQGKQSMLANETHAEYTEVEEDARTNSRYEHKDMIDRILYVPHGDKWATTSRDGTIRFWSGKDLSYVRTLRCGKAWVTDLGYLPRQNKLVASTFSRNLRIYDSNSLEVVGKLTELEHTPLTLDSWVHRKNDLVSDRVATGDNGGNLHLYQMVERDDEDKIVSGESWRLERLWKLGLHQDWVSKVRYMPDLNCLCSCSLDRSLALTDVERRSPTRKLLGHTKGVYSFDWSPDHKFIVSCGLNRHVLLWNPFSAKSMGSLVGHSASVQDVLVIERENQIVSVGIDKVIKVWDIRNHKCIQTFTDKTHYRPENRISAVQYDKARRQLLTAAVALKPWPLRNWDLSRSGQCHGDVVACALYNANFHQVVSGDRGSNVCVWEVESGKMRFRFGGAHGSAKITAMAFDKQGRRLITGASNGVVKVWNFSNGSCLKDMLPKGGADEVTALAYVHGGYQNKNVLGVGWNRKVTFWEDAENKKQIEAGRQLSGHADDIMCVDLQLPSTLATGSYDGVIVIWNIDSGAIKMKLAAPDVEKRILTERSIEKVLFLQQHPGVLVSCGADGCVRFWDTVYGAGMLLEKHTGHGGGEGCLVMCVDPGNRYLVTGDAAGIVKVWGISRFDGQACTSQAEADAVLGQRCTWRAHTLALTSVDYIPRGEFLVTASADCNVCLWSINGVRVGNFGRDTWVVEDISTWAAKVIEPIEVAGMDEEERWTSEAYTDSDDEEGTSPQQGHPQEEEDCTPMQMLAFKRFVKQERKDPPLSQRVWLPTGNRRLNHPHTPGRPATSIAHLLHIHDLALPGARPDTSYASRATRRDAKDPEYRRPQTVAGNPGVRGKGRM